MFVTYENPKTKHIFTCDHEAVLFSQCKLLVIFAAMTLFSLTLASTNHQTSPVLFSSKLPRLTFIFVGCSLSLRSVCVSPSHHCISTFFCECAKLCDDDWIYQHFVWWRILICILYGATKWNVQFNRGKKNQNQAEEISNENNNKNHAARRRD